MPSAATAFDAHRLLAQGPLGEVAARARARLAAAPESQILIFDDETGAQIDLPAPGPEGAPPMRGPDAPAPAAGARGRPRLGVTAREVTLLPRHWDWLGRQRGGASATLRRLVEAAMRTPEGRRDSAIQAAYAFLTAIAGDLAGYEEAIRALFRDDQPGFRGAVAGWPEDVVAFALRLGFGEELTPEGAATLGPKAGGRGGAAKTA